MALEETVQSLEQEQLTPEATHASNVLDATHALLAALDCPPKVRPMMSALFALTAGRTRTISFTRADLARRLYGGPSALPAEELARACERVTDDLGRMADWVHSEGLGDVFKYTPGTKDTPGTIRTRLLGWVAKLATAADGALSPTADDRERRAYFRKGAQEMVGKGLRRRAPSPSGRPKRKPEPVTYLRLGLSFIDKWWEEKSASFAQSDEELKSFLFSEIERRRTALCREKAGEETAKKPGIESGPGRGKFGIQTEIHCGEKSGQKEHEGVQGGGSMPAVACFDDEPPPTLGEESYNAMAADCGAMAGTVETLIDEHQANPEPDAPPLAPHLSADLASILAAASGRTEEHWRALYAAASVGALPTAVYIGGNGERGSGGQGWRIGQKNSTDEMTLDRFVGRFDELTARARRSGHSLIPTFDKLIIRDDCTLADVERLADLALIVTETSPGSYHVLMVVEGIDTEAQVRGFHAALDARGIGGNIGPRVGAARWAGTWNAKRGCDVRLVSSSPGRVLTREHLQGLGIVLPAALPAEPIATHRGAHQKPMAGNLAQRRGPSWRTWPSYQKALINKGGNRSAADASFFRISLKRGFDVDEIADKLVSVSERAREEKRSKGLVKELQDMVKRTK